MIKWLFVILIAILLDCHYYSFQLAVAPSINTKMLIAPIGFGLLLLQAITTHRYEVDRELGIAFVIACVYSVFNAIAVEINGSSDFSYVTYVSSFLIWIFAAIPSLWAMRLVHGKVSIRLLTCYLAAISTVHCIHAILVDKFESMERINNLIAYNPGFYEDVNRLYSLNVALDPAGTRFAIVLIMIAFVLILDDKIRQSKAKIFGLLFCYFIISVIGNMISRTTSVGLSLSMIAFAFGSGIHRMVLKRHNLKVYSILLTVLLIGIPIVIFLYNTDQYTHDQLRYGFEGFFNWMETGEWKTDSTDKLNAEMWIWPRDLHGWLIGYGSFGYFTFSTDIGYCRLILYSGVIGFSIFASLFVFSAKVFAQKYWRYRYMFLLLLVLSGLIWIKVATDLFLIYSLLYSFTDEEEAAYSLAPHNA